MNENRLLELVNYCKRVIVLESVGSTNDYAKQVATSLDLPALIVAREQTAGKGRMGRSFYSPSGTGIYMSAVLSPDLIPLATPAAAVAVCRAIEEQRHLLKITLDDAPPLIKWVNDVYIRGKKVCGILAETVSGNIPQFLVVGIGVNYATANFPEQLEHKAGSLSKEDTEEKITEEMENLTAAIFNNLLETLSQASECFMEEYKSRSMILGEKISFEHNQQMRIGRAVDITHEGHLLVEIGKEIITLSSGEARIFLRGDLI